MSVRVLFLSAFALTLEVPVEVPAMAEVEVEAKSFTDGMREVTSIVKIPSVRRQRFPLLPHCDSCRKGLLLNLEAKGLFVGTRFEVF